jgi:hypothetical protein
VEAEVARATEDLAEIRIGDLVPDRLHDERVRAAVGMVVAERQRTRRHRWLAAAAALLVGLVAGWYLLVRTPPAPPDIWLGSDEGLVPQKIVDQYSPFTWPQARPNGGRFILRIYDVQDSAKGPHLLYDSDEENVIVTSPWQLPVSVEATLPDEVYWEIEVTGGPGPEVHHAHARRRH